MIEGLEFMCLRCGPLIQAARKIGRHCLAPLVACALASLPIGAPALAGESADTPVWTPLQLSVFPPVQIPDEPCTVYGLSLGLVLVGIHAFDADQPFWGRGADDINGLQICGLLACARTLCGLQVSGLGNNANRIPCGIQVAGLFNYVQHDLGFGAQLAVGRNQNESGIGLQLALVNEAAIEFIGLQVGLCNWGESRLGKQLESSLAGIGPQSIVDMGHQLFHCQGVGDMRGLQVGLVNKAADLYGIQCGFIWNDATNARGLQLGLINIADTMTGLQIGLVNIINDSRVPFLPIINAHF